MPQASRAATTTRLPKTTQAARPNRGWLACIAIAYLLFVVYGSLVPLSFRAMSLEAALREFNAISYLQLGIDSRADWVANALLFIPLAFLWSGVFWPQRGGIRRAMTGTLVVLVGLALAVSIEFTQVFFPGRTVSINDIMAEGVGALIGTSVWWLAGARFNAAIGTLPLVRGTASLAERVLIPYLIVLLGYNLLPLDLTLSPVELYHKWNEGRILLLPFGARYDDAAHRYYDLLSDIVVWVPAAFLWKLAYRQPRVTVWIYVAITAGVVELLQLFVYSRVSDSTDIITASIGGLIGTTLAHRSGLGSKGMNHTTPAVGAAKIWIALMIWLTVLATVFWYPFDFNFDRSFIRERLIHLKQVPFQAFYFGSEFRAVTEVLHKTGFMLPLGILLAIGVDGFRVARTRGLLHGAAMLCLVAVAMGIEIGQVFLPDKNADPTDAVLESMGAFLGYWGGLFVIARIGHSPAANGDKTTSR